MSNKAFIIDCPWCKAKVSALERADAEVTGMDGGDEPYGQRIVIGECPTCKTLLVGESNQIGWEGMDSYEDEWSNVTRVYPKPNKTFYSSRIPKVVTDSLSEADRSMQADANIAACVMIGRALEALCRDVIEEYQKKNTKQIDLANEKPEQKKRKIMLGEGIRKLKELGVIDERLFDWSQQLNALRNLAAHPEDISISREDVGDLQSFVYAIVEYVYDLTDKYNEFKERAESKQKKAKNKKL